MDLPLVAALGAGAVSWAASLGSPGWTHRLSSVLRDRWRVAVAAALGLVFIALADPLAVFLPLDAGRWLRHVTVAPGLAARLVTLAVLVLPLAVDWGNAPAGLPGAIRRVTRAALRVGRWLALPLLAAAAVSHFWAEVWATVLGGQLSPAAALLAWLFTGASPPAGALPIPDTRLSLAVNTAVGGALAVIVARAAARAIRSPEPRQLPTPVVTGVAMVAILLLGFTLRWGFFVASGGATTGLSADGQSYFDESLTLDALAQHRDINLVALFFSGSTWFREPLFIYLLHAWLGFFGAVVVHQMYLTIIASLVWIILAAAAVWALLGRWPALLTGLLVAADDVWIRNAPIGLREEVTGTFLAAEVALLFARRMRPVAWLAPLCAAGAALTRLDALPMGLFILGWAAVAQRWSVRRAAVMVALGAALLGPTMAGYALTHGTAAPGATVISTNNWIDEFQDRMGQPGFERDRQVTPFEYLFVYHTPAQVAWYTVRGTVIIYGQFVFDSLYYRLAGWSIRLGGALRVLGLEWRPLVPLVFASGCAALLGQWRRWRTAWLPVALCVVGVLPPIGFSAGVPGHLMYQSRYGYLVSPFANAVVAWTVCAAVAGGRRALALRRSPGIAPSRLALRPTRPVSERGGA